MANSANSELPVCTRVYHLGCVCVGVRVSMLGSRVRFKLVMAIPRFLVILHSDSPRKQLGVLLRLPGRYTVFFHIFY